MGNRLLTAADPPSDPNAEPLLLLWGKTGPQQSYHPCVYHVIDVGHVAQVLLRQISSLNPV